MYEFPSAQVSKAFYSNFKRSGPKISAFPPGLRTCKWAFLRSKSRSDPVLALQVARRGPLDSSPVI